MEAILLLMGLAVLFGSAIGFAIRKYSFRKLRLSTLQKPQYAIEDDVSPAEFGYIVDGKIGRKELVSELVQLYTGGHVALDRNQAGKLIVSKTFGGWGHTQISTLQAELLKYISGGRQTIDILLPVLEREARRSLTEKGWIKNLPVPMRASSALSSSQIIKTVWFIAISLAVAAITGIAGGFTAANTYLLAGAVLLVEIILLIVGGLVLIMRGEALFAAGISVSMSSQYRERWKNLSGVYDYLRVSGMDIFTPDYDKPNFQELDRLYPYAVAAGLDKRILKEFA